VEYYSDNDFDTTVNSYLGGVYQQCVRSPFALASFRADVVVSCRSTSALSTTNASTYNSTTKFAMYGIEYTPVSSLVQRRDDIEAPYQPLTLDLAFRHTSRGPVRERSHGYKRKRRCGW
jgi:hypothetical protein